MVKKKIPKGYYSIDISTIGNIINIGSLRDIISYLSAFVLNERKKNDNQENAISVSTFTAIRFS